MIVAPKQPRNDKTNSRLSRLVPYVLRGQGEERCTSYMAGNLPGLDCREDAQLAVDVIGIEPRDALLRQNFESFMQSCPYRRTQMCSREGRLGRWRRPIHASALMCFATSSTGGWRFSVHHLPTKVTMPISAFAYIGAALVS